MIEFKLNKFIVSNPCSPANDPLISRMAGASNSNETIQLATRKSPYGDCYTLEKVRLSIPFGGIDKPEIKEIETLRSDLTFAQALDWVMLFESFSQNSVSFLQTKPKSLSEASAKFNEKYAMFADKVTYVGEAFLQQAQKGYAPTILATNKLPYSNKPVEGRLSDSFEESVAVANALGESQQYAYAVGFLNDDGRWTLTGWDHAGTAYIIETGLSFKAIMRDLYQIEDRRHKLVFNTEQSLQQKMQGQLLPHNHPCIVKNYMSRDMFNAVQPPTHTGGGATFIMN